MFRTLWKLLSRLFALICRVLIFILLIASTALLLFLHQLFEVRWETLTELALLGLIVGRTLWLTAIYISGPEIVVEADEALVVRRWRRRYRGYYQGVHRRVIGDRVVGRYSLKPRVYEGNEQAVPTLDGEWMRARCNFRYYVSQPILYHRRRKIYAARMDDHLRYSLSEEIKQVPLTDLWDRPARTNLALQQNLNRRMSEFGINVIDCRLEEIVLPHQGARWRRHTEPLDPEERTCWQSIE